MHLKQILHKIHKFLFKEVNAASLAVFRIGFGVICFVETIRLASELDGNSINDIVRFELLFKYQFFHWVELLPTPYLWAIIWAMKIAAILIVVGFLYRLSVFIYLLGYLYFFLVEMSHFNNHYYLFLLLLGFMLVNNANNQFSIDRYFRTNSSIYVKNWQLLLFKFQVVWVYFCAGLVKLNYDWLSGWTMRTALFNGKDYSNEAGFFQSEFMVYFYTWTGLTFDLFIGFLLLYKKTRVTAVVFLVVFHLINAKTLQLEYFLS